MVNNWQIFIIKLIFSLMTFGRIYGSDLTQVADIRCHCNLPKCIQTGYMCKSIGESAACFSQYLGYSVDGISDISRHGCIELLPLHLKNMCNKENHNNNNNNIDNTNDHYHDQHDPHHQHHHHHNRHNINNTQNNRNLTCCSQDMCNYVKNADNSIKIQIQIDENQNDSTTSTALPHLLWFRITVITVPIAGSLVLILLILLAAKVLRQDTKRQRKSAEVRKQRQFKTNLLLNGNGPGKTQTRNNYCNYSRAKTNQIFTYNYNTTEKKKSQEKNQTNAKLNHFKVHNNCDNSLPSSGDKNLYNKNINLAFSKQSNLNSELINSNETNDEEIFNKDIYDKPLMNTLYSSLLSFGKWDTNDKEIV